MSDRTGAATPQPHEHWLGPYARRTIDKLPTLSWQRLLALSGVVFAVLFVIGWFASGGDAPDYGASDEAWTNWADENEWKSRIGAFAMLLAGFVFLHFAGMIQKCPRKSGVRRSRLRTTRTGLVRRSRTGITGMVAAIVIIASAVPKVQQQIPS